jgi:hypothetical protein
MDDGILTRPLIRIFIMMKGYMGFMLSQRKPLRMDTGIAMTRFLPSHEPSKGTCEIQKNTTIS